MHGEDRQDYKLVASERVLLLVSFGSLLSVLGLMTTL